MSAKNSYRHFSLSALAFHPISCRSFLHSLQGKLKGFDTRANLILADCVEREFSEEEGVEMVSLGLYMIKGDNV